MAWKWKPFCTPPFRKIIKLKTLFRALLLVGLLGMVISYYFVWQWRNGTEIRRLDSPTTCNIPLIDPFSKFAKLLIETQGKYDGEPKCIGASVKFGIDYQNSSLVRYDSESQFFKSVNCCYTTFHMEPNNTLKKGADCSPINSDYTSIPPEHINLDIKCIDKETREIVYRDQLPIFRTLSTTEAKVDEISAKITDDRFSVVILGLDSVSRQNFIRYMPKSHAFLMKDLSALEFVGFNKVGRGTIENVVAMLSGCQAHPLGSDFVDGHCELLWEYYNDKGFRTIYFEDWNFNQIGIFPHLRRNRPGVGTHYNLSDFLSGMMWIDIHEMKNSFEDGYGCFDNQFIMDVLAQPIVEVAKIFASKPYFHFNWFSKTSHENIPNAKFMDDPLYRILSEMNQLQLLVNTILVVVSDHGPWHGLYLTTHSGLLERVMPLLYVSFPASFQSKYSLAFQNMKLNTKRLTTQYDLHETLMDLVNVNKISNEALTEPNSNEPQNPVRLGQSLFRPVSLNRTCETANIPLQYCMCWSRSRIFSPDSVLEVQQAATYAVIHLNSELQSFPECATLGLKSIQLANWLYSRDDDSSRADDLLEVAFTISPKDAEFLVTVSFYPKLKILGNVLRTNVYGQQSSCISSWANATYAKTMCACK